jgi:hypothetical protein
VRIGIDIDSTLHHYWDQFSDAARRLFGVELPYDRQLTWAVDQLAPDQLTACIRDTHDEARIMGAEPYEGAVEAISAWKAAGHFIHVTSHRSAASILPTARWLQHIGLPADEVYCSYDKVKRCVEIGIELLIDDSPLNLARAREHGIAGATLRHPWNREACESGDVMWADDWPALADRLAPFLAGVNTGPTRP